jgi:hypothetical protein
VDERTMNGGVRVWLRLRPMWTRMTLEFIVGATIALAI